MGDGLGRSVVITDAGSDAGERSDQVPVTVTEAVDLLRRRGYTADFELVDDALRSDGGISPCVIGEAIVEGLYRFVGPSDPGDQMIVFGLLDPVSEIRGTLATAFGPSADPVLYDISPISARAWTDVRAHWRG